jgi:hypothetical protein
MIQPPVQIPFNDENGQPNKAWIDWATQISRDSKYVGSDTTANRPLNGLNDGDTYLDQTLGYTITYYSGGWINSTGGSV